MQYNTMRKWVKALRSGKFKQGKSKLAAYETDDETGDNIGDELSFCCLGVLCEINDLPFEIGSDELLGEDHVKALGLNSENGTMKRTYKAKNTDDERRVNSLADLNDFGLSFKQLANIIEKNWRDL